MRSDVKKIGIIGAGVGGLIAVKTLLEEGFDCEVLERKGSLGGVWDNGYHSLRLQLPKESYEFLDWPMPAVRHDLSPSSCWSGRLIDGASKSQSSRIEHGKTQRVFVCSHLPGAPGQIPAHH